MIFHRYVNVVNWQSGWLPVVGSKTCFNIWPSCFNYHFGSGFIRSPTFLLAYRLIHNTLSRYLYPARLVIQESYRRSHERYTFIRNYVFVSSLIYIHIHILSSHIWFMVCIYYGVVFYSEHLRLKFVLCYSWNNMTIRPSLSWLCICVFDNCQIVIVFDCNTIIYYTF